MIISIDGEKALDKIQHPLMIKKPSNKVGIIGELSQFDKEYRSQNPTANIILTMRNSSFHSEIRWGSNVSSSLFFNIVLEVLANAIRQEE